MLCTTPKYNNIDTDADTFINQHEHSVKHLLLHSTERRVTQVLKWHLGKSVMTDFSFLGELSLSHLIICLLYLSAETLWMRVPLLLFSKGSCESVEQRCKSALPVKDHVICYQSLPYRDAQGASERTDKKKSSPGIAPLFLKSNVLMHSRIGCLAI